jgi:hypothetical protein
LIYLKQIFNPKKMTEETNTTPETVVVDPTPSEYVSTPEVAQTEPTAEVEAPVDTTSEEPTPSVES